MNRPCADGSTEAFVTSLTPIINAPVLTMQEEWTRDDRWTDRFGSDCSAAAEWAYVTGRVSEGHKGGAGVGERDKGNEGMTPRDFLERANAFVRTQAKQLDREVDEGQRVEWCC